METRSHYEGSDIIMKDKRRFTPGNLSRLLAYKVRKKNERKRRNIILIERNTFDNFKCTYRKHNSATFVGNKIINLESKIQSYKRTTNVVKSSERKV